MLAALDLMARFTTIVPRVSSGRPAGRETIRKILVIEPKNIGDLVLTLPFLAQLRALYPKAQVTLLANPFARQIFAGTDFVDEFIDTDLGWSERATRYNPLAYNWRELSRLRRELPKGGYDVAFKCCMHIREHIVIGFSGACRRIAYAFGLGDDVLTDPVPVLDPNRHKVADWLELAARVAPAVQAAPARLRVSQSEQKWAAEYLSSRGIDPTSTLVGIHPGASVPAKQWPLNRFHEVAVTLAKGKNTRVLAFVDPAGYGASLGEIDGVAAAQVSLRQLMALIQRCRLLVCNDSGPMHIAGALGVPTVAIFGTGINLWFAPLGEGHHLITLENANPRESTATETIRPYDLPDIPTTRVLGAVSDALGDQP
jgi:ADP-heptose:LPS heptosyltransferase